MSTCADVVASTLREAGIEIVFGLPGGEILDFMEAARRAGIRFLLVRHESTAAFMADVSGQIQRRPGVCVSTLGPGAVNMTLGIANAYLDRSPVLAITASMATASAPYATHQQLDLNAVYRPFTKAALTLDGIDTRDKVRAAIATATAQRMGPVHIAVPSDVARGPETEPPELAPRAPQSAPRTPPPAPREPLDAIAAALRQSRRPVLIVGLDVDPIADTASV
ncbi:MAG: thiamine pyrophosphate-binding protein, partial [Vicinamibacterales bacterium]